MSLASFLVVGLVFAYVGFVVGCIWMQHVCDTHPSRLPASFQPRDPLPTAREMRKRRQMRAELRANIVRRA